MKQLLLLLTFITCLSACNNEEAKEKEVGVAEDTTMQPAAGPRSVTAEQTPAAPTTGNFDITAEEETDDEVYYQKAKPSAWSEAGIRDPIAFKKFIKKLQYWTVNNMKDSIATVIAYPLMHPSIASEKEFVEKYDTYFTEKVRTALANQKLNQIYRSYQGVMLTGGELWFKQKENRFVISFINN